MIFGISRNKNNDEFYNKLKSLNTNDFSRIKIDNVDLFNKDNVLDYLEHISPNYIYNLADQALFINLFKILRRYLFKLTEFLITSVII